jgi:FkbM family methyltransferase
MVAVILPLVNIYRKCIVVLGSGYHTISIKDIEIKFKSNTFDEVRHFFPVYAEKDELTDLVSELTDEDIFYDIGAHIGIYTCTTGKVLEHEHIMAFEPHPKNRSRLNENMEMNGVSAEVFPYALADSNGEIEMSVDNHNPGSIGHLSPDKREESIKVDVRKGDSVVKEHDISLPTVMKIDIEGAELKALKGFSNSLGDCRLIYCEVSKNLMDYGDTEEKLLSFLRDRGFEITKFGPDSGIDHYDIKAEREIK